MPASSHDALAPRLWNAGPSTVTARTPPPYPVTFAAVGDNVGHTRRGSRAQGRGQRVRAQVHRQPRALVVVEVGQQRQQASAAATKSAPASEHHRHQVEEHTVEQTVQLGRRDAVGADPQHQRADAFCQGDQHRAVASAAAADPCGGNASATFHPDLTSRRASPPRTKGH